VHVEQVVVAKPLAEIEYKLRSLLIEFVKEFPQVIGYADKRNLVAALGQCSRNLVHDFIVFCTGLIAVFPKQYGHFEFIHFIPFLSIRAMS
jgi:hypothetical protein